MKAIWNGTTIAEAPQEDLIRIEDNWYFPPQSLRREYYSDSDMHTECFWKGTASYYNVAIDGTTNDSAAWYYHEPLAGSLERVGKDFSDYVAFWRGVDVA